MDLDDEALRQLLVSREVATPEQLAALGGEGPLRARVVASGLVSPAELDRLVAESLARVPTPLTGVARSALETKDSGFTVAPRDRARTVTTEGRGGDASRDGYPELPAGAVVRTRSGRELVIERELGRGGMGVVYLVHDAQLRRQAALKLMRRGGGPQRLERFRREAAITAHLAHPGVPPVYESGATEDGKEYLLLRYVAGRALSELLGRVDRTRARHRWLGRRGPWAPPRELLQVLVRVGETLAYAHSRGILHRDLKPDNVMVGAFGEVMVMDWGLARDAREERDLAASASPPGAPRETLVGTVAYMAPEQAREEEVDQRADVFAVGAILHELLTGRPPFAGAEFMDALEQARRGEVRRARDLVREVAPELDAIAARATAPDPRDRYASAVEFTDDLRAYLEGRPVSVHRYGPGEWARRQLRAHPTIAVALALLVAGVLAVAQTERRVRQEQVRAARFDALTAWADLERRPRSDLEARLGQAWAALQAADRWHGLAPDDEEAARARLRAAFALGEIALGGEQWSLAHQAFTQALHIGIDARRARSALERVAAARAAHAERRLTELRTFLDRIEADDPERGAPAQAPDGGRVRRARPGGGPGLARRPEELLDAAFEVVRRADGAAPELAARLDAITDELAAVQRDTLLSALGPDDGPDLAQALREAADALVAGGPLDAPQRRALDLAQARLAARVGRHPGTDAPAWLLAVADRQAAAVAPGRRRLAQVLCEALGRLDDASVVPALARHAAAEADPLLAAAAGRALVRLGQERLATAAAERRFGPGSPFSHEVRRVLATRGGT